MMAVLRTIGLLTCTAALTPVLPAWAQLVGTGFGPDTLQGAAPFGNPVDDTRVYVHAIFNQLEGRIGNGSYLRWEGQAWAGDDYNKLWLKSEGRYNVNRHGQVSDSDQELLYDRPVSSYFDIQAGVRYDLDNLRGRIWAALGIQGLAVGFWNVEATLYASDNAHFALKTNASYDLLLTQRLILQPQFETNWYSKDDAGRRLGSGLSDIDMGLRLRYELSRKLAPYVGVAYQRTFGGTSGYTREDGGHVNDLRFLIGLRAWF
jgi:copper resistance protein B